MIKKFLNLVQRHMTGYYSIPIGKKYLHFPKLAPIFTAAFLVTFLGDSVEIKPITYLGYAMIVLCVFGFLFYRIFPDRAKEEADLIIKNAEENEKS